MSTESAFLVVAILSMIMLGSIATELTKIRKALTRDPATRRGVAGSDSH